ncbi:phospholipid phosphatase-related protein type 4 [Aplochiton taeniatus]
MASRERQKGATTKDSVSLLPCFYFVEFPILVSSVVSLYFLELTDMFQPVRSGFTCHDRSLSLPYIDPTHEVIPLLMLLSLAFAGPAITIMIGEGIMFCCLSRKSNDVGAEADINAAGCTFNSFIRRAVRFVGVHVFGLCATALITDVLQLMTGYHTPYFLTVCKPNYSVLNVTCEHNAYVLDNICSGANPTAINQGRKSFPSQHASLASFAAVYVSMYFNSTLTDSSKLLKPLLVFSFTICAIICGLTRIIQYKNHPIDVYIGFLLGGSIAVYLGLYAVGNFLPGEDSSAPPPPLPRPPCPLPHISQEAVLLHHLQMKGLAPCGGAASLPSGLSASRSDGVLHRGPHHPCLVDGSAPGSVSSLNPGSMVTFSHTLPRVHTPQTMAAMEEAARRHATLHHATMDSSRSKQLLSQWKSKNSKGALHAPDSFSSSFDSASGQPRPPHHHGSMELRSRPEGGLNGGGLDACQQSYLAKLAAGNSNTLPSNCSGLAGGARISIQSRPGSSQLVHIPEEAQENYQNTSPRTTGAGGEAGPATTAAQANWQRAAEKSAPCRTNGNGCGQPRIMQVIAMSKQQGLLQAQSKSLDEGSLGCEAPGGQGLGRYRALTEHDPVDDGPSSLGSTVGSISGSTGAIVRVEAHPESHKPTIHPPSGDGSGSWRWRSLDHGAGCAGNGGGGGGRPSFELNDLNRDSESSDSLRESSTERKRANHVAPVAPGPAQVQASAKPAPPGVDPRGHPQGLTTIRVTPGDGGGVGVGSGAGEPSSDALSMTSSRDSTLRRKGNNIILIPERGNSPENTRNVFYKGTSSTAAYRE